MKLIDIFVKYRLRADIRRMFAMKSYAIQIEEAYDLYADAIFRHCYFRLNQRERAKELMQDTFMKAYQYLHKGEAVDNMRAFLYRIANNLIIDDVRKIKEQSLDALQEAGFDPTGADDHSVSKRLEQERVLGTLSKLQDDDRQIVSMRFIEELKPQEIGEILGLSPNVVSVRIHRALKELKTFLKKP